MEHEICAKMANVVGNSKYADSLLTWMKNLFDTFIGKYDKWTFEDIWSKELLSDVISTKFSDVNLQLQNW